MASRLGVVDKELLDLEDKASRWVIDRALDDRKYRANLRKGIGMIVGI